MQSLKSPYILYNQQSVGSTLHNNLLFITDSAFLIAYGNRFAVRHFFLPSFLKIHSHRIMAMYLTDSFPNRS